MLSEQQYRQQDYELINEILFYQEDNTRLENEITANNLEIMRIERKRKELYAEYMNLSNKDAV